MSVHSEQVIDRLDDLLASAGAAAQSIAERGEDSATAMATSARRLFASRPRRARHARHARRDLRTFVVVAVLLGASMIAARAFARRSSTPAQASADLSRRTAGADRPGTGTQPADRDAPYGERASR